MTVATGSLGYAAKLGKNDSLLITKLEMISKFGDPNPVTASHPAEAANEYSQQLTVSSE